MSRYRIPTTIVFKVGYTALAIPFTIDRMAALEDLMANSTPVSQGWSGEITAVNPNDAKDVLVQVLAVDIPEWVEPAPAPAETDDDETSNETSEEN
jgi:hypothetical protein